VIRSAAEAGWRWRRRDRRRWRAMSAVNCPMCELRFPSRNERDWHLRNEHEHMHVHQPADRTEIWWRRSSRDVHQQERPPTG